ncbi:NmrA-like family domain-containing protein [Paramyrothecium foliicola]|nr:NmrA-like family domain-containing protein [Paramyrothecium foliicola]
MPASNQDLILVFAAAGKQTRPLVPLLAKGFTNLRLVVNSVASQEALRAQFPNADVVRADQSDPKAVRDVFRGVAAVYYVGPSMHHQEVQNGYYAIDAAVTEQREGNFRHFVFSSVLKPQLRKPLNHDNKRYIEEYLFESPLNYTVLQPCNFLAENLFPIGKWVQDNEPVLSLPYDHNIPNSHIFLEDLAEVSLTVLKEREKHYNSEYPLSSTYPIAYKDLVEITEEALGKRIAIVKLPYLETVKKLVTSQFGNDYKAGNLDVAERLVLWYERYGLNGSPNILEWLLGRKPTTYEEWLGQHLKAAKDS